MQPSQLTRGDSIVLLPKGHHSVMFMSNSSAVRVFNNTHTEKDRADSVTLTADPEGNKFVICQPILI